MVVSSPRREPAMGQTNAQPPENPMHTVASPEYDALTPPADGETITLVDGELRVPSRPIIPFIEGDGTGRDIWRAASGVLEAAVFKAYGGERKIVWFEVLAGEKAFETVSDWLPEDALRAIGHHLVAIKGPLTTPVGGGIRSLNVAIPGT